MIIIGLGRRCIETRILVGEFHGQLCIILKIKLIITKNNMPYILRQQQYLIRLYFAITVNKSQSQFLKTVEVDLQIFVFIYRQLYVTLSQIIGAQGVIVLLFQNVDGKTNNKVYPEILF